MLFLLRLVSAFAVASLAATAQGWTTPYLLKLGSVAAGLLAAVAVTLMWTTRTRPSGKIRASVNPLRELLLGAFTGAAWTAGMLLYFTLVLGTPGVPGMIVDFGRKHTDLAIAQLEQDGNWLAASKVIVDTLGSTHTPEWTLELAERAVIDLTRAAASMRTEQARDLLEQAVAIASKYGIPGDLPRLALARLAEHASTGSLQKQYDATQAQLDAEVSKRLALAQHTAKLRLTLATALSQIARQGDLPPIRTILAREIGAAEQLSVSAVDARTVLRGLDQAIESMRPRNLPHGATTRIIRIHPGPMPGILLVDVEVKAATGETIEGLVDKDFSARQSGVVLTLRARPQNHSGSLFLTVLVDTSISTEGEPIRAARSAVAELIRRLPTQAHLRVAAFSDQVRLLADWTNQRSQAIEACGRLQAEGGTAIFLAIEQAIAALASMPGERIIAVFSDGANSLPGPSKEALIDAAKRHSIAVHFVALKVSHYDTSAIQTIAAQTGGQTLVVNHASELTASFQQMADKLTARGYRLAILDYDEVHPTEVRIGNENAVQVMIPPQR